MIDFLLGLLVGTTLGVFLGGILSASGRGDLIAENARLRELLRDSGRSLERYGEFRHLAAAIRHVLGDEAGG